MILNDPTPKPFRAPPIFGAPPTFGPQQTTPIFFGPGFRGDSSSTGFRNTTTAQPALGNFLQPQANSSTSFGQPSVPSAFDSIIKPATLGTFRQTAALPSTTTSTNDFRIFGQPTKVAIAANPDTSNAGYKPTTCTDTLLMERNHCITAMKEYENKSLEELRMEDYLANRKGPQGKTASCFGEFGATTGTEPFGPMTQSSTKLFGQLPAGATANKGLQICIDYNFGQVATRLEVLGQPCHLVQQILVMPGQQQQTAQIHLELNPLSTKPQRLRRPTKKAFGIRSRYSKYHSGF